LETINRERSERIVRKEKMKKKMMVAIACLTPDDRCQDENSSTVARQYKV